MSLEAYRNSPAEKARVADLMACVGDDVASALDVGARDGYLSLALAQRVSGVTALDLDCPRIDHDRIHCVAGDATKLQFPDRHFDLVLCSEVLEHIPEPGLRQACRELARVARRYVLVGVPYLQDTRVGRTTCAACGAINPPWGHVNEFDDRRLETLFEGCRVRRKSYIGTADAGTNWLSALLMNYAGNPYGTYDQDEPCIACGKSLGAPRTRTITERLATRAASLVQTTCRPFAKPHANWIHLLLEVA